MSVGRQKSDYRHSAIAPLLAIACSFWLFSCAAAVKDDSLSSAAESEPDQPATPTEPTAETAPGVAYTTQIAGEHPEDLGELLQRSSQLIFLQDKPPASLAALLRRTDTDVEIFEKVLRSEGYYDGKVRAARDIAQSPVAITIYIDSGPRYEIGRVSILYEGTAPGVAAPTSGGELDAKVGGAARAQVLKQTEAGLLTRLADVGFPDARISEARYQLNRATKTLDADFTVSAGPPRTFGNLAVVGLEETNERYLRRIINWPLGQTYDASRLDALRRQLAGLGIFDSVVFATNAAEPAAGPLPVTLRVVERSHRSVGFSVGASTDVLFELEAFWVHRNFFGEGEQLRVAGNTSLVRQQASLGFRNPNFARRDQTLLLDSSLQREDSDAFKEIGTTHFIGVERALAPNWTLIAGPSFELSQIDDAGDEDTFGLIGLPLQLSYDGRNDRLNPTEGWRLQASTTPYLGVLFESTHFWSNRLDGAGYLALDQDERVVLAGRGSAGIIVGNQNSDIPASKRFYAGGAGSVRGYEFRTVSPLDSDDDPTGGRSLLEVNLEARLGLTDTIGVVPFIDGGQVFAGQLFDKGGGFLWAGGLGLRYFSPIGPLRLDVAVPLNPRSDVDDAFEVYLSIGQAF